MIQRVRSSPQPFPDLCSGMVLFHFRMMLEHGRDWLSFRLETRYQHLDRSGRGMSVLQMSYGEIRNLVAWQ